MTVLDDRPDINLVSTSCKVI